MMAPKHEVAGSSPCWIPIGGLASSLYINLRRCGGLSMGLLQLKDPLVLLEWVGIIPGSGVLSRDMT